MAAETLPHRVRFRQDEPVTDDAEPAAPAAPPVPPVRLVPASLLELIRCPSCLAEFAPPEDETLTCSGCGLRYPVRGGVPILLLDEAQAPTED